MIRIDVKVLNEEVLLRLDTLPRRLRDQLRRKLGDVMEDAREDMLGKKPGKFLDPTYVQAEVQDTGGLLIGSINAEDKPGYFSYSKSNVMRFVAKSGDIVFTYKINEHPFPKGGPVVERYFREKKPWLIDQIEDTVFDVVYNAR
jgi:hypothetical protein